MVIEQNKIRQNLLSVYASNKLSAVNDDLIISVFFPEIKATTEIRQNIIEKLTNNNLYLNNKSLLEQFKKMIEKEVGTANILSTEQEVKIILSKVVLNRAISFAYDFIANKESSIYDYRMQLLHDLIKEQFINSGKWERRVVDHFDFVFPILKGWYSFFFSYTNKGGSKVNVRFAPILTSLININCATNEVARFVAGELQNDSNPISFIDERDLEYGVPFQSKIDEALKVSYSFVQFVSIETFMKIGARNWCQYEFDGFKSSLESVRKNHSFYYENALRFNMFFLVVGENLDDAKPAILVSEYEDWFNEIGSINYIKFFSTVKFDYSSFSKTIHNLALAIVGAQTRLIEAIPE